ncbi:hypothetical protein [Pseudoteredinibacter isoporae]|uniref:Uncharacterized protein n=1 Tax=Pseudoteredinibacter isoporae TaxID=570281 RepID=A0A7X0JT65_9GAMM|nr:hypothetical protein [Pseudoteredinibacter isoporae]MBB6520931.1 hypothetical protein [Pseudoteredinibacter isoporae]NHO86496.1 hypothetical protein [Pseudoteredinibacter isoporae]NIB25052.1 hypothetical protein [Pseudoteredinibacter isoporae]
MKKLTLGLMASSLSGMALAHPGHDHGHWAAEPIHLLTALAIASVIGTAVYVYRKQKAEKQD